MSERATPQLISLAEELDRRITRIAPELSKIRRHLHANPELSGEELASTAFIGGRLTAAGVLHEYGKERRGIITTISKSSPKTPVVAFRAELDALPIVEENDVSYRSTKDGVMHACGHDAHAAILFGTLCALALSELDSGWLARHLPAFGGGRSRSPRDD